MVAAGTDLILNKVGIIIKQTAYLQIVYINMRIYCFISKIKIEQLKKLK